MVTELKKTVGAVLDDAARQYPDADAVVCLEQGYRSTYAEFHHEVERAARGFYRLGIRKGDHVAIWATNYAEWVITQFATAKLGAVLVTVNPAYRTHELEYLLSQSEANLLVLIEQFKTSHYVEMLYAVVPELASSRPGTLVSTKLPHLRQVILIGEGSRPGLQPWADLMALGEEVPVERLREVERSLHPDEVINMQYTSGTTGFPKGAMLTHFNIVNNAFYVGRCQNITHQDRICIPVPFYHCFGCVMGTLLSAVYGAAMIIPAQHFDPLSVLRAVEQERATALYGVPTMWMAELQHPEFGRFDLSSLRTGIMAGAPCPIELMKQVVTQMHCPEVTIAYGQTEASPVVTQSVTTDPIEVRVSTVGRPLPGVEVKIVDPETGREMRRGQQGELCTRGYLVMKGYYNMPDKSREAIDEEGWLHTGDLAVMDEQGYCKITGRLKDMIIRGGENVYPREIEEFFYQHPQVADVQVVGVPDLKLGEAVLACIRVKDGGRVTEEELRLYCEGKIAHFKIPRYFWFLDSFPMTVTGKIQKFRLREMAVEKFALHEAARIETA